MNQRASKMEIVVEELKESAASPDGTAVVLETDARVDGELHDAAIQVPNRDVPAVAVALLNTDGAAAGTADGLPPAVRCLGAGVVHWLSESNVRLHLQFESGQVLPIEMSKEAALALCRGLFHHAGAATSFDPLTWGVSTTAANGSLDD